MTTTTLPDTSAATVPGPASLLGTRGRIVLIAVGVIAASWIVMIVLAARLPDGVAKDLFVAGRYIDRYEDRGSGWKIARRRELIDWARTDPASDSFLRNTPELARVMGARGDADFSNQRNWP